MLIIVHLELVIVLKVGHLYLWTLKAFFVVVIIDLRIMLSKYLVIMIKFLKFYLKISIYKHCSLFGLFMLVNLTMNIIHNIFVRVLAFSVFHFRLLFFDQCNFKFLYFCQGDLKILLYNQCKDLKFKHLSIYETSLFFSFFPQKFILLSLVNFGMQPFKVFET
jgi:hypothetical protein